MELKDYTEVVVPLIFSFMFIGIFLFFSIIEGWNYSGFNAFNLFALFVGIIALIFSGLSFFELKGQKWASIAKKILIVLIALCMVILVVYSYIIYY